MVEGVLTPGTKVKYWGNAAGGKYYGTVFTVDWANDCGCKHQTYSITNAEGKNFSQALGDNLTVVDE